MTRNIRLTIEYDGTKFFGWQKQAAKRTVQEEIQKAAERLFRKKIRLIGAGRTDSGVHAEAQTANFKIDTDLPLENVRNGLNRYLPKDIAVVSAQDARPDFHARFHARGKIYRYTIVNRKARSPLKARQAGFLPYKLDIKAMRKAAGHFIGKKDFRSFQARDKKERHSVRAIKKIDIFKKVSLIEIYIQADGFLYKMARNIVGTLIEVGKGKISPGEVRYILSKKCRRDAGPTAPAKGLCLVEVLYGL